MNLRVGTIQPITTSKHSVPLVSSLALPEKLHPNPWLKLSHPLYSENRYPKHFSNLILQRVLEGWIQWPSGHMWRFTGLIKFIMSPNQFMFFKASPSPEFPVSGMGSVIHLAPPTSWQLRWRLALTFHLYPHQAPSPVSSTSFIAITWLFSLFFPLLSLSWFSLHLF